MTPDDASDPPGTPSPEPSTTAPATALAPPQPHGPPAPLQDLARAAEDLAQASLSPATRRAYQASWTAFETWCRDNGLVSLPAAPETLALYLAKLAPEKGVRTINKALAAIALAYLLVVGLIRTAWSFGNQARQLGSMVFDRHRSSCPW